MNLQPFTIEAYERGEEVVYRSGLKPDEVFVFKTIDSFPVRSAREGEVYSHQANGAYRVGSLASAHDLMIKPKIKFLYANVYPELNVGSFHDSLEHCRDVVNQNFKAHIKLTFANDTVISAEILPILKNETE